MFLIKHICFYLIIVLSILNGNQGIYRSKIKLSDSGLQFQPVYYQGQILSTFVNSVNVLRTCYMLCSENILCRIFDINAVVSNQCRLFQGDMNIHGNMTPSSINNAQVGFVEYSTDLYFNYGQSCSSNPDENRYLTCGSNFTWICPTNTYWNSSLSMCSAQSPVIGSICQQNLNMCRGDLNYTCLQFNQCGPLSLLMGTTIADNNTIIANSPTVGLKNPVTILVNKTSDNSIIVANMDNQQVISFYDNVTSINNVSLISQNWSGGNYLHSPYGLSVHPNQKSNLYVSEYSYNSVIKITNMQVISPLPSAVAGVRGTGGSGTNQLGIPTGIAVDSNGNLYIADTTNSRIVCWPPNSTSGSVIAGSGTAGSDSFSLLLPYAVLLDETNSYIYVADSINHRIQRFSLPGGSPNNGTTVAGGNGQGSTNKQLNVPASIYITKKTNTMYIADTVNNRIQRWVLGDQSAVTIAGDPNGNPGSTATMLDSPYGIAVNDEETFLYVADSKNNRIQRFQLV